jgi:hypothetical protein
MNLKEEKKPHNEKHIALNTRSYAAEVAALRNDDNAIAHLQDVYDLGREEAEKMLQEIDLLCEGLLETSQRIENNGSKSRQKNS